jgi:hypothetical protein
MTNTMAAVFSREVPRQFLVFQAVSMDIIKVEVVRLTAAFR